MGPISSHNLFLCASVLYFKLKGIKIKLRHAYFIKFHYKGCKLINYLLNYVRIEGFICHLNLRGLGLGYAAEKKKGKKSGERKGKEKGGRREKAKKREEEERKQRKKRECKEMKEEKKSKGRKNKRIKD